jgi:hypothetical protein
MMNHIARTGALVAALALLCAPMSWAQTAAPQAAAPAAKPVGMMPPAQAGLMATAQVAGQTLKLNGKGVRYRTLVKVYEIGLYVASPTNSLEQFLAAPGAKRLQLITLRELTGDTLGVAMVQGMQDNAPAAERVKLLTYMNQLAKIFGEEPTVAPGSVLTIDFVPGRGTVLTLNGAQKGSVITDPIFFPAAARIWLGPKPVDFTLKDALLGNAVKHPESG